MKLPTDRQANEGARPKWRPISFWPWTLAAAVAVVVVAFVITTWLLTIASGAKPGTDRANARLDAVRTGLAAGAGVGAAVGLMLAFRRQHHQEIATDLTDRDATERRITELYTKAVEQLGNDKAPVRLGGLYALERLAQDNPAHRQTIVNVICAYLRMPFTPTTPASKPEPAATPEGLKEPDIETDEAADTWRQERQVRITAHRILAEHLRDDRAKDKRSTDPPSLRFWPGIRLDLIGATLIDFDLEDCTMGGADFIGATFSGGAFFGGTTFSDGANFDEATFSTGGWFRGATFSGGTGFNRAAFSAGTLFDGASFSGGTSFQRTTFSSIAGFDGVSFSDAATFDGASFSGFAGFRGASFSAVAEFYRVSFSADVSFDRATFGRTATFEGVSFSGGVAFDGVSFNGTGLYEGATFSGGEGSLSFGGSRVLSPDAQHVWPTGWRLGPDGSGGYTVVRANDDGRS